MGDLQNSIDQIGQSTFPVMITGESGTGSLTSKKKEYGMIFGFAAGGALAGGLAGSGIKAGVRALIKKRRKKK